MNQVQMLKSQLQKMIAKRQDVQNQIFNLQIFGETLNQKQQQIEMEIKEQSKVQTSFNEIHSESFALSKNEKSLDNLSNSMMSNRSHQNQNNMYETNPFQQSKYTNQPSYFKDSFQNDNFQEGIQMIDRQSMKAIQLSNIENSQLNQQLLSNEDVNFEQIDLENSNPSNINDLKYNPADKSSQILNDKNKKYLETLKMFQLEGNGAKHTEQVLHKMIENWVPKNQYKTKHVLSNGKVIDHSHIKSIPKAVIRLSDEVTGNNPKLVHDYKSLDILATDDEQTIQKKLWLKQQYDQFIKLFKQIQPKYIHESGYCKYTDSIRKTFVFFTQIMSRNKINRDSGVKPDTLKSWAKKYGHIDESILEIKDLDKDD